MGKFLKLPGKLTRFPRGWLRVNRHAFNSNRSLKLVGVFLIGGGPREAAQEDDKSGS